MKLQELINIEEKLLNFENENKFNMEFNDYVILNEELNNIGNITSNYFSLMEDYHKNILKKGLVIDTMKELLKEFNEKLLNSNVEYDTFKTMELMNKYH
ncbi:MAG: hypothetical protein IKT40_12190 [Bacilli bacterium]|nr:hypothetical protein [Bacilli bacterium]